MGRTDVHAPTMPEGQACVRMELLCVAKDPEFPESIEDAGGLDEEVGVAVVVDGASAGYDPQGWSRCLARSTMRVARENAEQLGAGSSDGSARDLLLPIVWRLALEEFASRSVRETAPGVPAKDSGATIGILRTWPAPRGSVWWMAEVVGDVNVVVAAAGSPPLSLDDLRTEDDYDSRPDVVMSTARDRSETLLRYTVPTLARPGDAIFMFSDGLGPWLTSRAGTKVFAAFRTVGIDGFHQLVRSERAALRMVPVDDVMMVRCMVLGDRRVRVPAR